MIAPNYRVEVDRVNAMEWSRILDGFEDANIYQTWAYGAIHWGERNLSHVVLRRDGEIAAIAQLRIIRVRFFRCGIAYLRWGPLCQLRGQELETETPRRMAQALHEEYVRRRGLLLRILPNAFERSSRARVFQAAFSQFVQRTLDDMNIERTFLLDLTLPLEELRKRLDQKWRNQLNRAERNGLVLTEADDIAQYKLFLGLYREMWERKRFETSVDVSEFARIQETLPKSQRMKVVICFHGDMPVAGVVCSAMGRSAVYLLGATSEAGLKVKAAYLLQWTVIKWLKENGFTRYDLGGVDPEKNPGVYHFKSGLSGKEASAIASFEACESHLSSVFMGVADFMRGGVHEFLAQLRSRGAGLVMPWRVRHSREKRT